MRTWKSTKKSHRAAEDLSAYHLKTGTIHTVFFQQLKTGAPYVR